MIPIVLCFANSMNCSMRQIQKWQSDLPGTLHQAGARRTPDNPFLRELIIQLGASGYVALFDIEDAQFVTILAIRHQRQDGYY